MKKTVREALNDAIKFKMLEDENVFLMGEEVGEYQGAYKVTEGLLQQFGANRIIDTPISEHGFTGLAIGAAFKGLKPIVEFMTFNFSLQAIDQIVNSAAKTNYMSGGDVSCPIVFRGPNGAAARVAAQHSNNLAAYYAHIPGLKVIAPYTAEDSRDLLISAIEDPNPVIFLENEILYGQSFDVSENIKSIEIGKANILRSGINLTIIASSLQVKLALDASEILKKNFNLEAEVIDLRSIKPLDKDLILESVKKTGRAIIVEEGWFFSGIGASIAQIIYSNIFDFLDAPIEVISGKDVPLPYAKNLEALALPKIDDIILSAKKICYVNS
ncbi:MAG: pyruvate dehydrogenase complex E1 component subunit beta [Rickettsia sp.]|nr:pyruvate dehydrogenase complex E1 component subunit beta [Rickettsia sp.]